MKRSIQVLVTGSDTGIGKTQAVAALARLLTERGAAGSAGRVRIVKVVETGRGGDSGEGDADRARRLSGVEAKAVTLASFAAPLSPAAAAAAEGRSVSFDSLLEAARGLEPCDACIFEGAGGIATPLDGRSRDWADFASEAGVPAVVIVVADRLGAINQARLAHGRAAQAGLHAGVWLNAVEPCDPAVAASNREGLRAAGVPLWAEQRHDAIAVDQPDRLWAHLTAAEGSVIALGQTREKARAKSGPETGDVAERCRRTLAERDAKGLRREVRVSGFCDGQLNLADNDYLALAHDPAIAAAVAAAAARHGTSASASPLITGWGEAHAELVDSLRAWHGFPAGLLWTSGYAANSAVLGNLPARGDLVLADRLIHHSMIAGLLRSGARLLRYDHLDLDRLESLLEGDRPPGRAAFVATESVFSMDGDYPDLRRMAELKRRHGFFWILDEAHGLGWYGPGGAGLARAAGVEGSVDVLVGTLGKTLASGGAYALFHDEAVRDHLANTAGEFVYSTALPPANAAAATAAIRRVRELAGHQGDWHDASRRFRERLSAEGWIAPPGDSPIVPVQLGAPDEAVSLATALREVGILAAAVRPPTVPEGTSRLRFSLKRTFGPDDAARVLVAMAEWRRKRKNG